MSELKAQKSDLSMSEMLAYQLETNTHTNILLFQPYFKQAMNISERTIDELILMSIINSD